MGEIILVNIYDGFLNPTNEYRGKPFWSWNDKDIIAAFSCKLNDLVLEEYEVITEISNSGIEWSVPWTYELFHTFQNRFGYIESTFVMLQKKWRKFTTLIYGLRVKGLVLNKKMIQ